MDFEGAAEVLEKWAAWCQVQGIKAEMRLAMVAAVDALRELGVQRDEALMAASRFAQELADARIRITMLVTELERLHDQPPD